MIFLRNSNIEYDTYGINYSLHKENMLYKKFGALESSMNKLNSQMNYFMQA